MRLGTGRRVCLVLASSVLLGQAAPPAEPQGSELDAIHLDLLYRQAQGAFLRGEYRTALPLLQRYVEVSVPFVDRNGRLFGVLDQIATIQLRELKDPDGALAYFRRVSDDPRLSAAERVAVEGWIASIYDWKQSGKPPDGSQSPDQLFALGKRWWDRAVANPGGPNRADLLIAMSYLLPFIRENDADPRVPEALYMVGYARSYRTIDPEYWTVNHYLQQAIQRAPHSALAWKAWTRLNDATRARYPSGLPPSIAEMLESYRKLAESR
jgi:hypothetical protein